MNDEFVGLEVCQAERLLASKGIDNFKFVYYTDKKQRSFDKEIVASVRLQDGVYVFTVCPMQFAPVDESN